MAIGVAEAGFRHVALIERDSHAISMLQYNRDLGVAPMEDWDLSERDVRTFDFSAVNESVDLLCAGPPCQPFSQAGKGLGHLDARDMFPATIEAIRSLRPMVFLIENVRGILQNAASRNYCDYIQLQLTHVDCYTGTGQDWQASHFALKNYHLNSALQETYRVTTVIVNAADFGVPQNRHRLFLVGVRSNSGLHFSLPTPTHSFESLLHSMWITGEYWDRHKIRRRDRPEPPKALLTGVSADNISSKATSTLPWQTVRDCISDLPEPVTELEPIVPNGHFLIPGARTYPGHTGSTLDAVAKTLKAGAHGVPGGENMILTDNGSLRYLTLRECARVQTYPDYVKLSLPWTRTMAALGNAVPTKLAYQFANAALKALDGQNADKAY